MSFYDAIRVGASGAADATFTVDRSIRYNRPDNHYFSKQPSSAGNRRTFTISTWVKRSNQGAHGALFYAGTSVGQNHNDTDAFLFNSSDKLTFAGEESQTVKYDIATTKLFRDPSAWYHIVLAVDTTQGTASNRIKIYVNGEQQTSLDQSTYPAQNYELFVNSTVSGGYTNGNIHVVGYTGGGRGLDGYLAEYHLIDGQQLTPSSFAETNTTTGQWIPIDTSGLTYGTNGFRLQFLDNSGTTATTLGKDTSGNSNNYTPNNFSVSAGAGNDSLKDTPTNNFPTFNNLVKSANTFAEGNLQVTMTSSTPATFYSTMGVISGKYYMEFLLKSVTNYPLGISSTTRQADYFSDSTSDQIGFWVQSSKTNVFRNGSDITANSEVVGNFETGVEGTSTTWAVDDIAGLALDMDNKIIYLYKGATQVGYVNFSTFNYDTVFFGGGNYINGNVYIGNFGQRTFAHTPPTGYKALCSANLADPTILLPNKHFGTILYTGDDTDDRDVTDSSAINFTPDWVWHKARNGANNHFLIDSVRGATKLLFANTTAAQSTQTDSLSAFIANGFTVSDNTAQADMNSSSHNYVTWNWNGGNSDGATYRVVVVDDSGNKYRFRNSANSATFDQSAVTLDLAEGGTYTFDGSDATMASHPIKLSTTANGTHGGGSSYNTGVTYELDGSTVTESAYVSGYSSASSRKLIITVAASAPTLYYYCHVHSGMGGQINTNSTKGSTNFDGSIQSTVKANTTAGFSIVSYEGNNTQGATVGHGLGVAPAVVIVKNRESTYNWAVWHQDLLGAAYVTNLNSTAAQGSIPGVFNGTLPTSTVFSLGGGSQSDRFLSNEPNIDFIVYIFSEVKNYSKFGKYKGNGSTDGVYVYTGFRPALVITKQISGAGSWFLFDNKRNGFNETEPYVMANVSNTEATDLGWDLLSNGFKIRNTYVNTNAANQDYIYLAFAESPFKNNRAR